MHFLFVAAQYLPTAGGVERYTSDLAATLAKMGHKATVVTSALPGLPLQEVSDTGVQIFRLPARLLMNGRFPTTHHNKTFSQLSEVIWRFNYDFAVINTRFYPLSLWAAQRCKQHAVPALVLEHGTKHLSLDNPLLNMAGNAYEHVMMKLVRHYCDHFYAVSQAGAQWLRHFHVQAEGVLYNAVDAAVLTQTAQNPPYDFRQKCSLAPDAPLVSFVGRFIVEKGVWELLDAFALLRQRLPNAALIMAGDGPLLTAVRQKAAPGVSTPGQLSHIESLCLMRQADVFCLPTYSEGFSSTILEAAAVGTCIVTTPTGGSPELIQNQKSGILLEDIRPETIADALYATLSNNDIRNNYGNSVSQKVQSSFTWPITANKLVEIARQRNK